MNRFDGNPNLDPTLWQPVHKGGGIYCSPGCGFGCTIKAWSQANRESAALAARMGEGWEARVWENSGWHYSVRKGVVDIHPRIIGEWGAGVITGGWGEPVGYTCFFNARPQVVQQAKTPEEALNLCLIGITETIFDLQTALRPFREDGL